MVIVTWDPNKKGSSASLSNGNLTATIADNYSTVRSTLGKSSGKWYLEVSVKNISYAMIGIVNDAAGVGNTIGVNAMYYYSGNGNKYNSSYSSYGETYKTGDIISILLDLDKGIIEFWKNGVTQGVAYSTVATLGTIYPATTSGSSSAGGVVTANFGATKFVYQIPKGYFSYDGSQYGEYRKFLITDEESINSYTYLEPVNITPIMTDNISEFGEVSSGSVYPSPTYAAWKAFDGDDSTWWLSSNVSNDWISFDFKKNVLIKKYSLTVNRDLATAPKNFTLSGWDGFAWTVLDTQSAYSKWVLGQQQEFLLPKNKKKYSKYKIDMTSAGGTYYSLSEMKFYSQSKALVNLQDSSEDSFLNYGIEMNEELDLDEDFKGRVYTKKEYDVLGSGKVFKHKIDTSKIPIKKVLIT